MKCQTCNEPTFDYDNECKECAIKRTKRETLKKVKRNNKLLIKELKEMSRRTMELDFIIVKDAINDYFKKSKKELKP